MSAPRFAEGARSADAVIDWEDSEALTRVIPQLDSLEPEPRPLPSRRQVANPTVLPSLPPPPPPPPPPRPRMASSVRPPPPPSLRGKPVASEPPSPQGKAVAAEPPPSAQGKPVAAEPPPSPRGKPVAAEPPPSPRGKPRSPVRTASYALLVVLAAGSGFKLLSGTSAVAAGGASAAPSATTTATAATQSDATNHSRPTIEVRSVDAPSVKEAALAFARGDYKEALAQYRALSKGEPAQAAYQSMVQILERRLAPK